MKSIYRLIKNTSLKAYSLILLAFVCSILGLSGCLQGFTMSASQVDEYYSALPPKPDFSYAEYEHKKIYFAQSTNVSHKLLFLIHGAPGAWFGYKDYLNDSLLLKEFKIVAADRFGYNHSDKKLVSIDEQAKAFYELLKKYPDYEITVVGRSYGAAIAAKLAMDYPNLVKKLFLISPACAPKLEKYWWFSKPVNSDFVKFFLPYYVNRASEEKFDHQKQLLNLENDWRKIHCPVVILQGGKDWIIDTRNGAYLDSMITEAPKQFIYLPENGHLLTAERKDLIKELLLKP